MGRFCCMKASIFVLFEVFTIYMGEWRVSGPTSILLLVLCMYSILTSVT